MLTTPSATSRNGVNPYHRVFVDFTVHEHVTAREGPVPNGAVLAPNRTAPVGTRHPGLEVFESGNECRYQGETDQEQRDGQDEPERARLEQWAHEERSPRHCC